MHESPPARLRPAPPSSFRRRLNNLSSTASVTLFALVVLGVFLAPLAYMGLTAFKTHKQVHDPAPPAPPPGRPSSPKGRTIRY